MCCPNGLLFPQKSLDIPFWSKKILRRGSHFTKIKKKNHVISAVFEVEKPLEMVPNLQKLKKKMQSNQLCFEGEKSLDMG